MSMFIPIHMCPIGTVIDNGWRDVILDNHGRYYVRCLISGESKRVPSTRKVKVLCPQ